ncbi:hypothetical protein E4T38_04292 [Aureobasidium subglaciale]|nr:hypothetical protein E4T38_04292 [Aureobasidium subglaciale]KAI5224060.1 hypothetical protein E4T40_04068 [Aureobasidium subglaciale]KAI5228332.1 hypothetical protein E4T41_03829 [Aureobasidium subglaciale]KAI5262877.1 hypothetical protein E4T46_04036 [Aureobasidium subglaciale]
MAKPNADENSCDEYPFASVTEGGTGAILRCTEGVENTAEGNALNGFLNSRCKYRPCSFMITFGNPNSGQTPFCQDGGGANDEFEYTFVGGQFQLACRGGNISYLSSPELKLTRFTDINSTQDDKWVLHKSDAADFFPPHLRREFLLEDGSRTVLPTRDLTISYDGVIFHTFRNNTVYELRAVRELHGQEKSPGLQDPSLQIPNSGV